MRLVLFTWFEEFELAPFLSRTRKILSYPFLDAFIKGVSPALERNSMRKGMHSRVFRSMKLTKINNQQVMTSGLCSLLGVHVTIYGRRWKVEICMRRCFENVTVLYGSCTTTD